MRGTKYKGQFGSKTDIGCVRENNEDQAVALINASGNVLLCVCDGMGGHNKGEYASKLAIDTISKEFRKKNGFLTSFSLGQWIGRTMRKVNKIIFNEAQTKDDYKEACVLFRYYGGSINFADCTILQSMQNHEITRIASFDKDFDKIKGIQRIGKI